jgi:hypothetical protein
LSAWCVVSSGPSSVDPAGDWLPHPAKVASIASIAAHPRVQVLCPNFIV